MNPLKASCISYNLLIVMTLRPVLPNSARAVRRDMGDEALYHKLYIIMPKACKKRGEA